MNFDKAAYMEKMKPAVDKLIGYLNSKGVTVKRDPEFQNMILTSSTKEIKISHHSFYRFSGIAVTYNKVGENTFAISEITDEAFINNYMKPIIEMHFELKK